MPYREADLTPQVRVIPALTIVDDSAFRTRRFRKRSYVGDPVNAVKLFSDKGADELMVIDISGEPFHHGRAAVIRSIASEALMPISYGGGIRDIEAIRAVIRNGYEKAVVNTALFDAPDIVREAVREFGSQALVASIETSRGWFGDRLVLRDSGARRTRHRLADWARSCEDLGCGEILLTCVDRDGSMTGYDLDAVEEVSRAVTVPVIAMGGAGTLGHLHDAVSRGASAVAAGSMFVYFGPRRAVLVNYPSGGLDGDAPR
jgi:cyclase